MPERHPAWGTDNRHPSIPSRATARDFAHASPAHPDAPVRRPSGMLREGETAETGARSALGGLPPWGARRGVETERPQCLRCTVPVSCREGERGVLAGGCRSGFGPGSIPAFGRPLAPARGLGRGHYYRDVRHGRRIAHESFDLLAG